MNVGLTEISIFYVFLCYHIPVPPLVDNDFLTQFESY